MTTTVKKTAKAETKKTMITKKAVAPKTATKVAASKVACKPAVKTVKKTAIKKATSVKKTVTKIAETKKTATKSTVKKAAPKKVTSKTKKMNVKTDLPAFIAKILDDGKATNILSINLTGKTSLTDYLIIASGTSTRHVMALATTLTEKLKDAKYKPKMDGRQSSGEWVVIDVGEVIVHIFVPETRSFYEIEALWGEKTPIA